MTMMNKTLSALALCALPALSMAAGDHAGAHAAPADAGPLVGQPGESARAARTVEVTMDDTMRFVPAHVRVKAGETVRFSVRNAGRLTHEMVIGSIPDLKAHAARMRDMPDMRHAEANAVTLDPGGRADLVWRFGAPGVVDFACLIPGHLEAGMAGKVTVE